MDFVEIFIGKDRFPAGGSRFRRFLNRRSLRRSRTGKIKGEIEYLLRAVLIRSESFLLGFHLLRFKREGIFKVHVEIVLLVGIELLRILIRGEIKWNLGNRLLFLRILTELSELVLFVVIVFLLAAPVDRLFLLLLSPGHKEHQDQSARDD